MLKLIRKLLLKSKRVQRAILVYQVKQKKQRHHERWAQIMSSGRTIRDTKKFKASNAKDEHELCVDYLNGRRGGQSNIGPLFIDSTNWGR